jgi:hypothetical protein
MMKIPVRGNPLALQNFCFLVKRDNGTACRNQKQNMFISLPHDAAKAYGLLVGVTLKVETYVYLF